MTDDVQEQPDGQEVSFAGKWGRVAGYTVFGAIIFSLFSLVLVTAMTQQQVTRNLAGNEVKTSYQEAYFILNGAESRKESRTNYEQSISDAKANIENEGQKLRDLQATLTEDTRQPVAVAKSARARALCPGQFPESLNTDGLNDEELLDRVERCKVNTIAFEQLGVDPYIFGKIRGFKREVSATEAKIEALSITVEEAKKEISKIDRDDSNAKALKNDFLPQTQLTKLLPWWVGWIFDVPPSIMPILLTFVSGIFGSLLVNLILIVYPNNSVGLYQGQRFTQHVILGGLIATAVYIVMKAGVSVLSLSDTGDTPDAFLTFSAIGIFAGMFSDRAARWLSENVPFDNKPKPSPPPPPRDGDMS